MLSAEQLRETVHYDPDTGRFTWRVRPSRWSPIHIGDVAGKLNSEGYIELQIARRRYKAHRLAWLWMTGALPTHELDHKNRDRADNRWQNLREATPSQNRQNKCVAKRSFTGVKGVHLHRSRPGMGQTHWVAQARANGVCRRVRCYGFLDEAAEIYANLAKELHGEFFRAE